MSSPTPLRTTTPRPLVPSSSHTDPDALASLRAQLIDRGVTESQIDATLRQMMAAYSSSGQHEPEPAPPAPAPLPPPAPSPEQPRARLSLAEVAERQAEKKRSERKARESASFSEFEQQQQQHVHHHHQPPPPPPPVHYYHYHIPHHYAPPPRQAVYAPPPPPPQPQPLMDAFMSGTLPARHARARSGSLYLSLPDSHHQSFYAPQHSHAHHPHRAGHHPPPLQHSYSAPPSATVMHHPIPSPTQTSPAHSDHLMLPSVADEDEFNPDRPFADEELERELHELLTPSRTTFALPKVEGEEEKPSTLKKKADGREAEQEQGQAKDVLDWDDDDLFSPSDVAASSSSSEFVSPVKAEPVDAQLECPSSASSNRSDYSSASASSSVASAAAHLMLPTPTRPGPGSAKENLSPSRSPSPLRAPPVIQGPGSRREESPASSVHHPPPLTSGGGGGGGNKKRKRAPGSTPSSHHRPASSPLPPLPHEDLPPYAYVPLPGPRPTNKPSLSYAALIGQAILTSTRKRLGLSEIYLWIMASWPYYKKKDLGWQNSIRHNLSLNDIFVKRERDADCLDGGKGKGCFWAIQPGREIEFEGGTYNKRRAKKIVAEKEAREREAAHHAHLEHQSALLDASAPPKKVKKEKPATPAYIASFDLPVPPTRVSAAHRARSAAAPPSSPIRPPPRTVYQGQQQGQQQEQQQQQQRPAPPPPPQFLPAPTPTRPGLNVFPTPSRPASLPPTAGPSSGSSSAASFAPPLETPQRPATAEGGHSAPSSGALPPFLTPSLSSPLSSPQRPTPSTSVYTGALLPLHREWGANVVGGPALKAKASATAAALSLGAGTAAGVGGLQPAFQFNPAPLRGNAKGKGKDKMDVDDDDDDDDDDLELAPPSSLASKPTSTPVALAQQHHQNIDLPSPSELFGQHILASPIPGPAGHHAHLRMSSASHTHRLFDSPSFFPSSFASPSRTPTSSLRTNAGNPHATPTPKAFDPLRFLSPRAFGTPRGLAGMVADAGVGADPFDYSGKVEFELERLDVDGIGASPAGPGRGPGHAHAAATAAGGWGLGSAERGVTFGFAELGRKLDSPGGWGSWKD